MRYFRYKGPKTTEDPILREEYKKFIENEKKLMRRCDRAEGIGCGLVLLVTGACLSFSIWGLTQIPQPEGNAFLIIAYILGIVVLGFGMAVISLAIGGLTAATIFNWVGKKRNSRERILLKACEHLREYYGLQEPCIVTKCYESSDKKFKNHDVCIFVADEELRITTNLKNGFIHSEKDLGCHAFLRDEISLTKIEGEKFLMAELKAGETTFLLGYRAKGFIEKNFLAPKNDT